MTGLFFCLASAEGAGLLFFPRYNTATRKRLQQLFCRQCNYTTHDTKQRTGLYGGFSSYLPCFAAVVWRVHPAIPHRLRHAGAPTSAGRLAPIPDTTATPGRCTGQRRPPIIIRYIRVKHIADHASPAGQSSGRGTAGGAEPLAAAAVSLSGFRPIANRG